MPCARTFALPAFSVAFLLALQVLRFLLRRCVLVVFVILHLTILALFVLSFLLRVTFS